MRLIQGSQRETDELQRSVRADMRAVGRVLHLGRQTAVAEGSLLDAAGKLYAQATTTCLVSDIPIKC